MAESLNLLGQCAQPLTVIPLYRQLRKLIENEIAAGRWKPNERIPSEAELSRMFSVSRITVRAALTELADEGMLVKIQGKGTFVTNAKSKQLLTIGVSSFEEMCRQNDLEPKRVQLFKKLVDADERDMVQLGAKRGEKIVYPVSYTHLIRAHGGGSLTLLPYGRDAKGTRAYLSHFSQRELTWSANLARSLLAPPLLCSMTAIRRFPAA